ncbi:hypothetical protein E2C01_065217 [Portunus trituberculatus]|uniref:Uncharacterized protein n=1 Tax=Portunus trituberculatus TaxID=210409 RepID=A0A5B7HF16_PORTR|nr:hypothetical protein [Portunus trituberculatus]
MYYVCAGVPYRISRIEGRTHQRAAPPSTTHYLPHPPADPSTHSTPRSGTSCILQSPLPPNQTVQTPIMVSYSHNPPHPLPEYTFPSPHSSSFPSILTTPNMSTTTHSPLPPLPCPAQQGRHTHSYNP